MRTALRGSPARMSRAAMSLPAFIRTPPQLLDSATIPAPVKGWDAANPLENMDPAAAIQLENWFPEPSYVRVRGGHSSWATGLGSGPVESLMAYHGPSGTQKMFGARGTSVFDVSANAAVGAAAITSTGNARWQHCHQTTSGGHFLIIANGSASLRSFDGTSWATPSISGITSSNVIHVNVHQRRLWMTQINSTQAAYLPVDSIAGTAATFDLGPLFSLGGYLNAIASWTRDGGSGPDDLAVFISSKGQVAIYTGTDPSSSATWALIGVFNLAPPIGRRCFTKVGGDLAVITMAGVVPLSQALALDTGVTRKIAITSNIQNAMNQAAKLYSGNYGWQLIPYPLGTAVYMNVPLAEGSEYQQFVMNPLTGAWCKYTGMNAACWEIFNDNIYFGGLAGIVYKADTTGRDNGSLIVAQLRTAFNHFKMRGVNKSYRTIRPLMISDGVVIPSLAINTDYASTPAPTTLASVISTQGKLWGQFNWNDGTLWAGGDVQSANWISCENEGHCASVNMRVAAQNQNAASQINLKLNGFDIKFARAMGQL